jgi:hypothetical protein
LGEKWKDWRVGTVCGLYGLSAWVSLDLTHKKEENEDFRVFLDFSFFTFFLRFLHEQDFLIFKLVLPTET